MTTFSPSPLRRLLPGLLLLGSVTAARAQGVRIGTPGTPDASAALDVSSTSKGLLPPRLTTAQRNAINPASSAAGLVIFNTDTKVLNTWDGVRWVAALADTSPPVTTTFTYTTNAPYTYTVPVGVTALVVDMAGAAGGTGGGGGRLQDTLAVTSGQVLTIYVGQRGSIAGGFNGGGNGGANGPYISGGGGGASDIRTNGTATATLALADRVLVAGGGGGSGSGGPGSTPGGAGGGSAGGAGGAGPGSPGGDGGTQLAGGAATPPATPGTSGTGGMGGANTSLPIFGTGGGGGGGYYGGGGGGAGSPSGFAPGGGGGGGSSYPALSVKHTQNYAGSSGNGYVSLTPFVTPPFTPPTTLPAPYLDASNFAGVIKNQTTQQAGASFNISGNGSTGGNLTVGGNGSVGGTLSVGSSASITGNGSVGGTLTAGNNLVADANAANAGTLANGLRFGGSTNGEGLASKRTSGGNQSGLDFYTSSTNRLAITNGGNVGIGTSAPAQLLDVEGTPAPAAASTAPVLRLGRPDNSGVRYASSLEVNVGTYGANNDNSAQTQVDFRLGNGQTDNPDMTALTLRADGRVGISTTSPRGTLDVAGGDTYLVADPTNGNGQSLYLPGHLYLAPFGPGNNFAYVQARVPNATPSTNLGLVLRTTSGGSLVAALTLAPGGAATFAGPATGPSFTSPSDARFKTNVRPLTGALAAVQALRGVRYEWNALGVQHGGTAGAGQVGVLAQELEKLYPELVLTNAQGFKSVNYAQLTPVLIEALKELKAENDALKAGAAADHADLQTMKAQLARLLGEGTQAQK